MGENICISAGVGSITDGAVCLFSIVAGEF